MRITEQASQTDSSLLNKQNITALAGGLGLALSSAAQSGIIYTDITNIISNVSGDENFSFDLDLDGDYAIDFTIDHRSGNSYVYTSIRGSQSNAEVFFNNWYATAFSAGDTIGSGSSSTPYTTLGSSWGYGNYGNFGNFPGIDNAFIGLQFEIDTELHYGWLQIGLSSDVNTLTIYDFAYESAANTAIIAGDKVGASHPFTRILEPTSLALMATGALGIIAFRRRKKNLKNLS